MADEDRKDPGDAVVKNKSKRWPVAISKSKRVEIEARLKELSRDLKARKNRSTPAFGLVDGLGGISLYLFSHAGFSGRTAETKLAHQYLEIAVKKMRRYRPDIGFHQHWPGLLWLIHHLKLEERNSPDFQAAIELCYESQKMMAADDLSADVISGLSGFGQVLLATQSKKHQNILLPPIIDRVAGELKRRLRPRARKIDLGFAHGIPGLLAFLTFCYEKKIRQKELEPILESAAKFLLKQIAASAKGAPKFVGEKKPARQAWCYGDPGLAVALARAGVALKNKKLIREAQQTFLRTCAESSRNKTIRDAGLCHGSAGVTLIAYRLWQMDSNAEIQSALQKWLDHTIELFTEHPRKLAAWRGRDFQDGIALNDLGPALVLMNALKNQEPDWDQYMLLSAPK